MLSFDTWGVPQWINDMVNALTLAGLWVAIAVAILRYRLYDIDRIISRTVSYALSWESLVWSSSDSSHCWRCSSLPMIPYSSQSSPWSPPPCSTRRLQLVIDRRINRSKYDAERGAESFTETLQSQVDPDGVVGGWLAVVETTMQPVAVGVWVKTE